MRTPCRPLAVVSVVCLAAFQFGCGDPPEDKGTGLGADAGDDDVADVGESVAADVGVPEDVAEDIAEDVETDTADAAPQRTTEDYPLAQCDDLDPTRCGLPWPSNLYLAPDEERPTGYQLRFGDESLPKLSGGSHADPTPYRRRDGYGLGTPILAHFPDVDTSAMPTRFDIEASMDDDAPVVLLEADDDGVEQVPFWAELDARASPPEETQLLIVRPAVILEENTRYIVAYRNLQTTDGEPIEASDAFRKLRDGEVERGSVLAERQERFEEVFGLLEEASIDRDSLTLAWDFRTASGEGLRGSMLSMRSQAIEATGPEGPTLDYESEDVEEIPADENPRIGLEIEGTFEVPHFMESVSDAREWVFHRDDSGEVAQNGTRAADFYMRVPQSALDGEQVGVVVYGHGLLGDRSGIDRRIWARLAEEKDYILVAADWTGMAKGDRATAASALRNIDNFQGVADRMHQGILEFLMLLRSSRHRLSEMAALTDRGVDVDGDEVFYVGASQGGIYGQTVMALTDQIERGFLAVPGNNYSTMLQRSSNFGPFRSLMEQSYPSPARRLVAIAALQQLWDGTDPISYAGHIETEPLVEGAPDRDVLLALSKGDHQVPVVTNEILARSRVGIPLMAPYDDEHQPWNVPTATYPRSESGTILFDYGNPWPDRGNRPPSEEFEDPHGKLGEVEEAGRLIDSFFREGEIVDVCGGATCDF